jgi:predicted oxidoreductase (fatty acid repression mutant protein)
MQAKFPRYAATLPTWANHSDGMAQHIAWTALEAEGLGASLQHYNPLIDTMVQETWNVPKDWELSAQLVIGAPAAPPETKTFGDVERVKVYGA